MSVVPGRLAVTRMQMFAQLWQELLRCLLLWGAERSFWPLDGRPAHQRAKPSRHMRRLLCNSRASAISHDLFKKQSFGGILLLKNPVSIQLRPKCRRRIHFPVDSRRCHRLRQWLRSAYAVRDLPTSLEWRCPRACRPPAAPPAALARRCCGSPLWPGK